MKIVDDIKLNKTLRVLELYVCQNKQKQPVLAVKAKGSDKIVHLKRFFGFNQYRKFLLESVLLHLIIKDYCKSDIARMYKALLDTCLDDKHDEIL